MKSLSISEVFRPMIILSTILGTHPFHKHKNTISWSRVKMLFSLTCILIYVTTAVLFFIRVLDDTTDKIFIIMLTIKCFGCMAVLLVIMFSSHANFRKNLKTMTDIAEIDTELRNFGQEERIARSTYRHRKWLILLIFGNLFYNICSDCLVSLTNRFNLIDILVTITYPRIIVHNTNIIYCVVTIMIGERFKIVNELLHTLNPRSKEFSDKVNKLVFTHRLLVKVCQQLNSMYALQFLVWITQCFILLLNDVHLGIYAFFFAHLSFNFHYIFTNVRNCILNAFDLFYLSKRSAALCFEVIRIFQIDGVEQKNVF
jgi:hypothetical protein